MRFSMMGIFKIALTEGRLAGSFCNMMLIN
jgi:hypothetical protein